MWQIGYLVLGVIVKAQPDRDAYLVILGAADQLAVLPKRYADRTYKVGENVGAVVVGVDRPYPILSQRSARYLRKVANVILAPLIQDRCIRVRAVATATGAHFMKVAVEALNAQDPVAQCLHFVREFRLYTTLTPALVRYRPDLSLFIKEALVPAPVNEIQSVELWAEARKANVVVSERLLPKFLGKAGLNVAVASKLTGVAIHLVPVGVV